MKRLVYYVVAAIFLSFTIQCTPVDSDVKSAGELAKRVLGNFAKNIKFEKGDADSVDYFSVKSVSGKVVIVGNNANSMAMGLNYYLKNYCLTTVSWYKDDKLTLPETLPLPDSVVTVKAIVPNRFFLNYCTFGYTMPWWKWSDWEHFIDWMALNGINMPLAITGQEAIWYKVWSKLGLSDEQIRAYFTGPAHLPWHRMCNLDRWQGDIPMSWLESQAKLQKLIVDRERELNMRPILPGFAGHVPEELNQIYPGLKTTLVSEWGGFADEYRCTYLSPTDSLFAVIQKEYLTEQTALYGTDHIYGIDPFNEVDPPTWDIDSLGDISRSIYESVTAVDSDAVWLQMAWFLYADVTHWTPERTKVFMQGVPKGKMMLLDYFCENTELWKMYDKFYEQPYIWCYLGNFGGNSFLCGPAQEVSNRLDDVYANGGENLVGLGSTLEGLDVNPYMYEYVFERAWNMPQSNIDKVNNIADRRTGAVYAEARQAWQILASKIYISPSACTSATLNHARPIFYGNGLWVTRNKYDYDNADLVKAWGMLLDVDAEDVDAYNFDIVNIGRQALGNYFTNLRDDFTKSYEAKDVEALKIKGEKMVQLIDDITELLACHPSFSMNKWLEDARAEGADTDTKNYFEKNARTLVTIWGDSYHLTDYANRDWAELNDQYYGVRWKRFVEGVIEAVEAGKKFDEETFFNECRDFENGWIDVEANPITIIPQGNAKATAKQLYEKYSPMILN
ncbi:MAG: alpha-N-acetylglucosaminidase [Muribaculaceae bacterium]|nr:alpha-N-acetylglucosaminidase [Muribaculaceae bacterium]